MPRRRYLAPQSSYACSFAFLSMTRIVPVLNGGVPPNECFLFSLRQSDISSDAAGGRAAALSALVAQALKSANVRQTPHACFTGEIFALSDCSTGGKSWCAAKPGAPLHVLARA